MFRKLVPVLLLTSSLWAQNFVTVTASHIGNGGSGLLPSGVITFQATSTAQQPISYQVGGGGQQILLPTTCSVTNGAIIGSCLVANVILTQPQNFCFNVTVKNSSGQVVLGGRNSGYQCVQTATNNDWCTAGTCNLDTYVPNLPSTVLIINLPPPQLGSLGGIYAGNCASGLVVLGYNTSGNPNCGPGGGPGSAGYNSGSVSASIGSTNIASSTNFPTGQYLLNCDVVVTATGTSPTLAVTIGWTDISGTTRTKTCTTGVVTVSDNPITQTITSNGSAAITVTQTLAVSTATWQTTVALTRLQ